MFKKCNVCNHVWNTRKDFIDDIDVMLIGYEVNFKELKTGLFYFNHKCKNTIGLHADVFADLYSGPIFQESKLGTNECPEYCVKKDELRPCPAKCECAYIREIIQLLRKPVPV